MLVVACVSLLLNLLEIYHLGWKKVKQGVTNEFVPDRDSLLMGADEPGDAETIPEQTSPPVLDCLPAYASVSVVGAAAGGAYSSTEASLNPNMANTPIKMDGTAFHPDDFLLEALPASYYGNSKKGSAGQLSAVEQNWSNMALELNNLDGKNSSSSSYPPPIPSPPTSNSSSPQETTPTPPQEEQHSSYPTLPRNTPLYPLSPQGAAMDEENTAPCTLPYDDFTVVTRAEMHQPPAAAATDIRKPRRASKSSSVRARPDDLAV